MSYRDETSHVPAEPVTVGTVRRQVCAWCGTLLEEVQLSNVGSLPPGQPVPPYTSAAWGRFGGDPLSYILLPDTEPPADACCRFSDGGPLSRALADQALGTFGAINPTDEQREALADSLIAHAVAWIDDEFNLGLRGQVDTDG